MIPDALMRGFNVACIVNPEEMQYFPGCVAMSNLLPHPYSVIDLLNAERKDPNYPAILQKYMLDYQKCLLSKDKEEPVCAIIASIYKTSKPLLLFVERESNSQFHIIESVAYFLRNFFGIIIGPYENIMRQDPNFNPGFIADPRYMFAVADLLFCNGYISKKEYAYYVPEGCIPSERACSILLSDYNYVFPNLQASITAVINIIRMLKEESVTGKTNVAFQITEKLNEEYQKEINNIVANSNYRFGRKPVGGVIPQETQK